MGNERRTCVFCREESFIRRGGCYRLYSSSAGWAHGPCLMKHQGAQAFSSLSNDELWSFPTSTAHAWGHLDALKQEIQKRRDRPGSV